MTTFEVCNRMFALLLVRQESKEEVAGALSISERTLGYIYRQDYTPDLELAHRISDYFGLPLDHVFWRYPPRVFPNAPSPLATVPVESAALGELQLCLWKHRDWVTRAGRSQGPYDALDLTPTQQRADWYLASSVEDARHNQPLPPSYVDGASLSYARMRLQSAVADEIAPLTGTTGGRLLASGLNRSVEIIHEAGLLNAKNAEAMILAVNQDSGR